MTQAVFFVLFVVFTEEVAWFFPAPTDGEVELFVRAKVLEYLQEAGNEVFDQDGKVVDPELVVDAVMTHAPPERIQRFYFIEQDMVSWSNPQAENLLDVLSSAKKERHWKE